MPTFRAIAIASLFTLCLSNNAIAAPTGGPAGKLPPANQNRISPSPPAASPQRPRALSLGSQPRYTTPVVPNWRYSQQPHPAPLPPGRNAFSARGTRGSVSSQAPGMETARQHYQRSGMSRGRAQGHMQGIDPRYPPHQVHIPGGVPLTQHVKQSNGRQGNYYSYTPGPPAEKLGINPQGRSPVPYVTPPGGVTALRSRANRIVDTWSNPREPYPAPGGGIQLHLDNTQNLKMRPHDSALPTHAGAPGSPFPVNRRHSWPNAQAPRPAPQASAELRRALQAHPRATPAPPH